MEQQGFFRSLFDISFTSFITTKIIKFLYVLAIVLISLAALVFIVVAFKTNVALGVGVLVIGAPLVSLLYLIYIRLMFEFLIQIFRITELLRDQNQLHRTALSGAGLVPLSASAGLTPTQCPSCGAAPTPGAAFCRHCGQRLI